MISLKASLGDDMDQNYVDVIAQACCEQVELWLVWLHSKETTLLPIVLILNPIFDSAKILYGD